jgi:twitching motility protein PilI
MANRDALRELQTRLAERLQAAQASTQRAAWLAVECAGVGLLFPLAGAGEIFVLPALLQVPHTQPWFAGVANLRGGLHGVVDLAAFLGLRPPLAPGEPLREQSRVLALNPALGSHCALMFDRLAGLRNEAQLRRGADGDGPRPPFAGASWLDDEGRGWQEIDLPSLAAYPPFVGIAQLGDDDALPTRGTR